MKRAVFILCLLLVLPGVSTQLNPKQWRDMTSGEKFAYTIGFREGLDAGMEIMQNYLQQAFEYAWSGLHADMTIEDITTYLDKFIKEYNQEDFTMVQLIFLLNSYLTKQIPQEAE